MSDTSASTPATPPAAAPAAAPGASTPAPAAPAVPTSAPAAASFVADALKETAKPADAAAPADSKPAIELKLPEGFTADEAQLSSFKALAGELGLDTPKAQKVFEHYVAVEKARTEAAEKAFAAQDAKWLAELQADPEIGGDKLQGTVAHVRAGLQWIGPELGQVIHAAGLGNHPAVVRALAKVGRGTADDTVRGTSKPSEKGKPKSDAEIF